MAATDLDPELAQLLAEIEASDASYEYEVFGVVNCVFLDVGAVMLVACYSDNKHLGSMEDVHAISSIDFEEFEELGLTPDKSWEGRRCKLVYAVLGTAKKLVGAILGKRIDS